MTELNRERILVRIIKELALELDIDARFFSQDWIISLSKNRSTHYIYGYQWGLNSAAAQLMAKDKTAAYEILDHRGIKAVEHKLFFSHDIQAAYTGQKGYWEDVMRYVEAQRQGDDYNLVCKPNRGTGGNDVYRIKNQLDLEGTIIKMSAKYRDFCLCPFYPITHEYRVIILNGKVHMLFRKERPQVSGNGADNILTLAVESFGAQGLDLLAGSPDDPLEILPMGEVKLLSWKHNLAGGARAHIVEAGEAKTALSKLALAAGEALGICFASIDIALINGEYRVMEINSGIMTESFARQKKDAHYDYYELAKDIYRQALVLLFNQD